MYTVEISDNQRTCEKTYKRVSNAIKAATKAKANGYIYFDNPYLYKWQRKVSALRVTVYNTETGTTIIEL